MNKKESSVKIQLLNKFRDYHIVAWTGLTAIDYDRLLLSNALWKKLYNGNWEYKPDISEYFKIYQCELIFEMFCATSALGIS